MTSDPRLEFHRDGIALLPAADDPRPGVAAHIRRSRDGRQALRTCSCGVATKRKAVCRHLTELEDLVDDCHAAWDNRSWNTVATGSPWHALARILFDGAPLRLEEAHLDRGSEGGLVVRDEGGAPWIRTFDTGPRSVRLGERLGCLGTPGPTHRSRALQKLRILQVTAEESAMNERGLKTQRQAFEESVWYLFAYHCMREHGLHGGGLVPAVEIESGHFVLTFVDGGTSPTLRLVVPRKRVEGVLALLARLDVDGTRAVRTIPLKSLFGVTRDTELDLDVRPAIQALQSVGEARFLTREQRGAFRYGRLVYLPNMGLLAELETPGFERKFGAPLRMELRRSLVPGLRDEGLRRAIPAAKSARAPSVLHDFDTLELVPEAEEAGGYWLSVRYGFGNATVTLADVLRARNEGLRYLETPEGWVDVASPVFDGVSGPIDAGRVRLSPSDVLRLTATTTRPVTVREGRPGSFSIARLMALAPSRPLPVPSGLTSLLRPYQRIGLDWLRFLFENRLAGLLCDDMGLGKTHEAMALMVSLTEQLQVREPFLVVAPTSVLTHWLDKLARFAPGLRALLHHGPDRRLDAALAPGTVVVTSYGVLRNDVERLRQIAFGVLVLDEVQHLKNRDTLAYQAAAEITATMKLGLTGTPIENDLHEAKALFDLVLPGYMGTDRDFERRYLDTDARSRPTALASLRRILSPFVLRRLKTSVLDELPDKIEDVRTCFLSDEQMRLYREAMGGRGSELLTRLRRTEEPIPYLHVFALLSLLKKVCDHPALALGRAAEYEAFSSGKWDLFTEILEESLDADQKVVVFSQFLGMIDIMERHLRARSIGFVTLTGSTRERGRVVGRFNDDPACRVFLGSLKAGGTGIDLVAGSVVVHYDRWWNAAKEDQATDRVHRIGQKRAVQVFKLLTEGTLEEKIAAIIERKRSLMEDVFVADHAHLAKVFTREELIDILSGSFPDATGREGS